MIKTRWFIYTVLVGLIPIAIRGILYSISNKLPSSFIINESDLITFGLVLNLSNINEIENNSASFGDIKVWYNGISALLIIILSVLLGLYLVNNDIVETQFLSSYKLKIWAGMIGITSFILGYATFDRIKKAE